MPGVRAIFHRQNIGKMYRSVLEPGFESVCEERRPPFEDDVVRYYGQYIALAVADTFETAKAAADAVRATYAKDKPNVENDLRPKTSPTWWQRRLAHTSAWKASAATPRARSRARRSSSTNLRHAGRDAQPSRAARHTAIWEGSTLTMYESSQGVVNQQGVLAQMFGLPKENVRVITKFVGSGFGQQAVAMDAMSARRGRGAQLGKPVNSCSAAK